MFGFGRECSLCGGKLNGDICTECGLDNSKNDSSYETARSHSRAESLTHVHEKFDPFAGKTMTDEQRDEMKAAHALKKKAKKAKAITTAPTYQYTEKNVKRNHKKNSGKKASGIGIIFTVIFLIIGVFNGIIGSVMEEDWEADSYEVYPEDEYAFDPYEFVEYELDETGEFFAISLTPGEYKGGVHIPEGSYEVYWQGGEGALTIEDDYHGIYQSFRFGAEEDMDYDIVNAISDFRIYEGSRIAIEERVELCFETNNAYLPMISSENPNTESFEFSENFWVGAEIPAGVYDIKCLEGSGIFNFTVEYGDGYTSYEGKLIGTGESAFPDYYKNVVLPEGTEVEIDGLRVELIPSETIESEDYISYYEWE